MSVDIETIGFGVDTAGVKTGSRDLDGLGRSADQASRKADNLGKSVNKSAKEVGGLGKSADLSTAAIGRFGGAIGIAFSLLLSSRALADSADKYTKLTAQIRNATRGQEEFNTAFSDTTRIAKVAQSEIESVTKLYARLNLALRDANRSQYEVATVTETVALALKVNGASVGESTSAMLQLSQAFGSGVLRGEEFNAVMEAAPNLMRQLATSMGVPIGQLRNLASEGHITVTELTKAFTDSKYLSTLREQAQHVRTIGGAWQVFKNELILSIGEIDKAAGASNFFSALFGGAGFAVKELSGRGGNTTVAPIDPEKEFLKGLKSGLPSLAIGDTPEIVKKREAVFAELTKTLRLTSVETERLNALQKQANEALAAGNITGKMHAQIVAGIRDERTRLAKKNKEEKDDYADLIRQQNEMIFAENEVRAERILRIREEQIATVEGLEKQLMGWDDLTQAEQAAWEIQNGKYKDFDVQSKDEILRLTEMLDLKKQIADLEKSNLEDARRIEDEMVNETLAGMKKRADENSKMWESIEDTAHDTFVSIFKSGKSTFDRLRDTLKNGLYDLLYQMTIKKWIFNISAGASGGMSGAAGASELLASSGSGGLGSIGNILSTGKSLISGFQGSLAGSIESLGATIANGMGGFADTVGGFLGTYSSQIANVLPFAGAAIQLLSGDAKGAAFTAAGAALGSFIPGIGTAIGGMIGSVVGSFFGGKDIPLVGSESFGSYSSGKFSGSSRKFGDKDIGAGSSLMALNEAFTSQLGGLFKEFGLSDKMDVRSFYRERTNKRGNFYVNTGDGVFGGEVVKNKSFQEFVDKVLGSELVKAIQRSKLPDGIRALFDGMTDKAMISNMINATVGLNRSQQHLASAFDITVNEAAKVADATGLAGDALIKLVNTISASAMSFAKASEILLPAKADLDEAIDDALDRDVAFPTTMAAFDMLLKDIDTSTAAGIQMFADLFQLREGFASFTNTIDSLKAGVDASIYAMSSPEQQLAIQRENMAKLFDELGMNVPGSVQELIDLGKSIDLTTAAGIDLASVFPTLVSAFVSVQEQTDNLISSLNSLDTTKFGLLVDYNRAVRYAQSGINIANLPSYDVGTSYVPQDGPANIHAGERIFTRTENAEIVEAVRASNGNSAAVVSEIRNLRAELKAGLYSVASSTAETARINRKWDGDGIPETRDITA
jgi:tape measure domain-containing protein